MELTVEEEMSFAAHRASEKAAELHHFKANQPHFPLGFSVHYRNPGHWDVVAHRCPGKASAWKDANPDGQTTETDDRRERAFRIRGDDGDVVVHDERWDPTRPHPRGSISFRSVSAAMLWISEELMQEPQQ